MLAQASDTSLPAKAIAFLLIAGVITLVVWGAMCLSRRFRNGRALGAVGAGSAVLTGLLFSIPTPERRAKAAGEVAIAPRAAVALPNGASEEREKFWAPPTAQERESKLATDHIDRVNGYAIRFPKGWTVRDIKGDPWIIEATDGVGAYISIGVTPNPSGLENAVAKLDPSRIEQSIRAKENSLLHARGADLLQGVPYLFYKYTAAMPMTDSSPRMTMVHYLVPREGRIMEVRIAAIPETFRDVEPLLNVSMSTLRLVPEPPGSVQSNAER